MSRRSSSISSLEAVPGKIRNLVHAHKPEVTINIDNQKHTYSTLDKIQGSLTIVASVDTPFDDIEIEFVGTSRTFVERLTTAAAVSGKAEAFHQFLKLTQPGLQQLYPEDGVLRSGKVYTFPFVFVVPQQLLLRICQHKVNTPVVRDSHLQLPPTFGDKETNNEPGALDDMAPEMASIRYGVFAKISKSKVAEDYSTSRVSLCSKGKALRVIPAYEEDPPLDVASDDQDFCMRKEKTVRKGVLKGKAGTLVAETIQPSSLLLRANDESGEPVTSMASVMLRFDPVDDDATPPRLGSLSSKLKVCTFFASSARTTFPTKNGAMLDLAQGMHSESLNLAQRCVANVEWQKHDPRKPHTLPRPDSACSMMTSSAPAPSAHYKGKVFYTARILTPITLPSHKAFVPTFHSCLISRSYMLKLDLSLPSAGVGGSMDLKMPIQVSCDPNNQGDISPGRSGSIASDMLEDSTIDEGADDVLRPRTIRMPSEEHVGRSFVNNHRLQEYQLQNIPLDAPPSYSAFAVPTTRVISAY